MKDTQILVTGNLGFLGSNVAKFLDSVGMDVYGIDDRSFGTIENRYGDFYEQYYDCFNNTSTEFLNEFDCIIHCATHNIISAQTKPVETVYNNAQKTIDFFSRYNGKIVNISTSSVYGDPKNIPTKESDGINCSEAYSISKRIVEMYLEKRGNFTTIRPANFYGINQRADNLCCGVLGRFIDSAINDKAMTIYGDGTDTRSYLYVSDVVSSVFEAVLRPATNQNINVGSSEEISAMDLCRLVWKIVDKPVQYQIVKPRQIDTIKRRALDCSRAKELLGWEAKINLEEGIKRTIEWYNGDYN